jgi:hypothetical protein
VDGLKLETIYEEINDSNSHSSSPSFLADVMNEKEEDNLINKTVSV